LNHLDLTGGNEYKHLTNRVSKMEDFSFGTLKMQGNLKRLIWLFDVSSSRVQPEIFVIHFPTID